jgi:integrase
MRGSIVGRYKGSWSIVLDLGYQVDPETGTRRRRQKWITVRGTKKQAGDQLTELVRAANRGEFVEPSKKTLGEWLDEWVDKAIKPPARTLRAYETYKSVIATHLKPTLGLLPLQQVKAVDLKRYYDEAGTGEAGLAPATLQQHHTILHSALQAAVLEGLVQRNVAKLVIGKPHAPTSHQDVLEHCWEAHEAKAFLAAAKAAGPQPAAFYALALDTGMRKAELCGLGWTEVDLAAGRVTIQRQLVKPGPAPVFGPVKNKTPRTIEISTETVGLLRRHRTHQAEIRLRNGQHYHDHGLVFAKEWGDLTRQRDTLGDPLQVNNLGGSADQVSRPAPYVRDPAAPRRRGAPHRPESARAQADRDHAGDLRPCPAGDAAGRGREAGGAAALTHGLADAAACLLPCALKTEPSPGAV